MRRLASVLCLVVAVAAATACGEKEERVGPGGTERVDLLLDFFANADHAPIYAALAQGYFEQVGLDVRIRQPSDPAAPIKQVAAGQTDLAISYEPEVLLARDRGLRVVSVGALVQEPLTSIISLPKAGIRSPADLRGKVVGTAGIPYQPAYLRTILEAAGIDPDEVRERNIGFNFSAALVSGRVDATLGAFWNYEGTDLRLRRRDPRIIRVEQVGVPTYDELVFVANEDGLERDGDRIRRFLGALARGTRALQREPRTGLDALLRDNRDLDRRLQREVIDVTLPLFAAPKGRPYGYQDPNEWRAYARWMRENGLLERLTSAEGSFTNELLPGRGP